MKPGETRVLGRSGVEITVMDRRGAPLGDLYQAFPDAQASSPPRASEDPSSDTPQ